MMLEAKLTIISEGIRKTYNSKWAIFVNLFFFLFIFVLQSILVAFTIISAPTNVKTGNSYWWLILIEMTAATSALISSILTIRINKNFFYFNTFSLLLWSVNSLMLGLYVDNIKIILLYIPIVIRFSRWRTGEHHKITPRRINFLYMVPLFIFLTILSLLCGFFVVNNFDSFPLLDSFNLIFGITQGVLIAYGIIEGLFLSYLVSACLLWINLTVGNYIGVLTTFIFFTNFNANIMAWLALYHHEHGTFRYQKQQKTASLVEDIFNKYL